MKLKELWKERQQLVESALAGELNKKSPIDKTLTESMEYSLMAGGKRLRPVLLMAAADALGTDGRISSSGSPHTQAFDHDEITDDIYGCGNRYRQQWKSGVSDPAKQASKNVICDDEHQSSRTDPDIRTGFGESLFRCIHQVGQKRCIYEH